MHVVNKMSVPMFLSSARDSLSRFTTWQKLTGVWGANNIRFDKTIVFPNSWQITVFPSKTAFYQSEILVSKNKVRFIRAR